MRRSLTISPLFSFRQQLLKLYFSHLCHLRHKLRLRRCWHCKYPKFRCFYMVLSKHFLHWALFHFNPLPPCGGRPIRTSGSTVISISIHSLRVEGDGKGVHLDHNAVSDFNPLPPCGGRPKDQISLRLTRYFNPLPPCGGRPHNVIINFPNIISIHSLRVEGDR